MDVIAIGTFLLLLMIGLNTVANVALVGKPRSPMTGSTAVFVLIINALSIFLIVELARRAGVL